jgi:leucyl aminopeptidase
MINYKYIKNYYNINDINFKFIFNKNKNNFKYNQKISTFTIYYNDDNNYNNQLALAIKKIIDINKINNKIYDNIVINLINNDDITIYNTIEICEYLFYNYNNYKTYNINNNYSLKNIILTSNKSINKSIINSINKGKIISESTNLIKDLINMPANELYPKKLANIIFKDSIKSKFKCTIFNENKIKKLKLNTILSVSQGSKYEPQFIILEYKQNNNKPILLVGKGVTFDTGGISLKTDDFSDMKTDMTGAAVVFGIIRTIAKLNINTNIVAILPIVENMVSKNATRPGDIITSYSGKTIEITDTDAEGRLILADALSYGIKHFKPREIIDIATLTGAAENITNGVTSMIMGNNNILINNLINSGLNTEEFLWQLPLWKIFIDRTKSDIADIKNYSFEHSAGSIMGGAFLANFVDYNIPWAHIDLSGAWNNKINEYMSDINSNGKGVRLGVNYIINNP